MIIGVDFDNTIVSYDDLMCSIALEWGIISAADRTKRQIRDALRKLPDGEMIWQRLQIAAYGLRMNEAVPTDGVMEFFLLCKQRSVPVRIISHKTMYPNLGESAVNLRSSAMTWLKRQGFLAIDGHGVGPEHIYFESSRVEKIARIRLIGVTHFIDDLEETFDEPGFPPNVKKILYSGETSAQAGGVTTLASWGQIREYFFPVAQQVVGPLL